MGTGKDISPIACEPCRQKKCKCNRALPYCSQCTGEPSKCNYPENGKRGLPLGYLTQLEQRLADTELALFEALTTLRSLGHGDDLVKASLKVEVEERQGKNARMGEWGRLPLRDQSDIQRWWQAKDDQYIRERGPLESRTQELDPTLEENQSAELGGTSILESQTRKRIDTGAISAEAAADRGLMISGSPKERNANTFSNQDLGRPLPEHPLGIRGHRSLGEQGVEAVSTDRASILASRQPSLYF
ncbi:hypothetical protein BO78DRAFT_467735 [Aspergillus sclerotiicarbonarius CBS 121057]|uniref:Zn(2)-C6 fungal-type domain-containing protein n=1 Tax=Aspergillus sclerotiicarbonarius (strain CBS 121057 / IBT 28362) TaxID=1448318 RepID=A0A319F2L3_ASPSB|nr:hypothetical protein BO78DRAFT_467735 [Aspergillus sclerotiicarbonarius CBS 121057]